MTNQELQDKILTALHITGSDKGVQDRMLAKVASIAQKRLLSLLPGMLNDKQLQQASSMELAGKSPEDIAHWIETQLPATYEEMLRAIMLDVAEEAGSSSLPH